MACLRNNLGLKAHKVQITDELKLVHYEHAKKSKKGLFITRNNDVNQPYHTCSVTELNDEIIIHVIGDKTTKMPKCSLNQRLDICHIWSFFIYNFSCIDGLIYKYFFKSKKILFYQKCVTFYCFRVRFCVKDVVYSLLVFSIICLQLYLYCFSSEICRPLPDVSIEVFPPYITSPFSGLSTSFYRGCLCKICLSY